MPMRPLPLRLDAVLVLSLLAFVSTLAAARYYGERDLLMEGILTVIRNLALGKTTFGSRTSVTCEAFHHSAEYPQERNRSTR
jgi:hypothetical protein